jgi:hypothetical protein
LGLSFETDWGEENIVVKSVQSGNFAARETDIRVGDVLIEVNGIPVTGKNFEDALSLIKSTLTSEDCAIKLRTVEEKLRLMRDSAFKQIRKTEIDRKKVPTSPLSKGGTSPVDLKPGEVKDTLSIRVELRQVESSVVILASELDRDKMEEYRIENQSVSYKLYFRQKGIPGDRWKCVDPGQTCSYIWEDPFKPHRLAIHVGENILCPSDFRNAMRFQDAGEIGSKGKGDDSLGVYLSYLSGMKTDTATIVNLDEIGFLEMLPVQKSDNRLIATIRSEGPTKVLVLSPGVTKIELMRELSYSTDFIFEQLNTLREFSSQIDIIQSALDLSGRIAPESNVSAAIGKIYDDYVNQLREIQNILLAKTLNSRTLQLSSRELTPKSEIISYSPFTRLFNAGVDHQHQVMIEILEVKELNPFVQGKVEDVYCQIYLRDREKLNLLE